MSSRPAALRRARGWLASYQLSRLTLIVMLYTAGVQVAAQELLDRPWTRYQSAHFTFYSDLPEAEVAQHIRQLELFREVVFAFTGAPRFEDVVPMEFYLLSKRGDLVDIAGHNGYLGYMQPTLRVNYLVAGPGRSELDGRRIVFHEFVHYLLRGSGPKLTPRWYDEGLAELLSTARFKDDEVVIGADVPQRLPVLLNDRISVSLSSVLQKDDISEWNRAFVSQYYAWSWALAHYLYLGRGERAGDLQMQLAEYFKSLDAGHDRVRAFKTAFNLSTLGTENVLKRYLQKSRRPRLTLPLRGLTYDAAYTRTQMSKFDMSYRLGYLALSGNTEFARSMFDAALQMRPGHAHALSGKGVSFQFEKEFATGEPLARQALQLAPEDWLMAQELADLLVAWCDAEEPPPDCAAKYREALALYEAIIAAHPERLETQVALAELLGRTRTDLTRARTLIERTRQRVPWFYVTDISLATITLEEGDYDGARSLLRGVLRRTEDENLVRRSKALLQEIDVAERASVR